jgi:hypothetical protein
VIGKACRRVNVETVKYTIRPCRFSRDWSRSADVILILNLNLVDQEIAAAETASKAEFYAAAVQSRTCLLAVKKGYGGCLTPHVRTSNR